ncbi:aldehyde dehydrogenase family protein [Patescibacteria group bacterium]|nr:aldehyde dehydrogenase family protein [Patescibacteria group bacterium]MBU1921859.1 aldehyde dehydrogenase family protein [Patescibacteria group bacterium]
MARLISTNPSKNYEILGEVNISSDNEIREKVALANKAKVFWKELGIKKRIELLKPICEEFRTRSDEIAELITREMGKPIIESIEEVNGYVEEFEWFMNNAEVALEDEVTHEDKNFMHKIVYEPFGVAAVISPWNFPFGMAIWGIIPNLLAGNTVVFKISEECPLLGRLIEEVMTKHGLPQGVFSEIYGAGDTGENLAKSDIDLLWFTGSTKVGKSLYKIAADKFIKAILEMGGSNPCVVFDDADIPKAIPTIYDGRFQNCGQACDALKRLIVHKSVFDKMVGGLKELLETKIVGDPFNKKTDIGSLVAKRQSALLQAQVKDALNKGATIITGGGLPQNLEGAFHEPTILTNIKKDMRVWTEEVFGPVLPMMTFNTEEEAIELANDTVYGLGARVFTKDIERAKRVASKIEAGTVEINQASRWLPCNPFGGYKDSGMGREHGTIGFRELCQIKVVSMEQ